MSSNDSRSEESEHMPIVYCDGTVLAFSIDFIVNLDVCFAGRVLYNNRLHSRGRLCNEATTI
jgi:hypothetical protein